MNNVQTSMDVLLIPTNLKRSQNVVCQQTKPECMSSVKEKKMARSGRIRKGMNWPTIHETRDRISPLDRDNFDVVFIMFGVLCSSCELL
jgi:hypothetical protein